MTILQVSCLKARRMSTVSPKASGGSRISSLLNRLKHFHSIIIHSIKRATKFSISAHISFHSSPIQKQRLHILPENLLTDF